MRRLLKFLHTMGSAGLLGAMASLVAMLAVAPAPAALPGYAAMRGAMGAVATWMFLPALALTLMTGLLAMALNRAYVGAGWAWLKLATGVLMFEGGLVYVQGPMRREAEQSAQALAGRVDPATLAASRASAARSGCCWRSPPRTWRSESGGRACCGSPANSGRPYRDPSRLPPRILKWPVRRLSKSLPNTKSRKQPVEHILDTDMAADLAQRPHCKPQVLRGEFREATGPGDQPVEMGHAGLQRRPVTRSGDQRVAGAEPGFRRYLDGVEQRLETRAGPCRDGNVEVPADEVSRQIDRLSSEPLRLWITATVSRSGVVPSGGTSSSTRSAPAIRARVRAMPSASTGSAVSRRPAVSTSRTGRPAEIEPDLDRIPGGPRQVRDDRGLAPAERISGSICRHWARRRARS